ncbi:hypothetical protein Syun_019021 [Stephania yunnanensis]|uniref:Uncharacterized protein n=1 Tax=Stephania yunnanensis TaxID=152371 RepID=A0AAP0NWX2_9MAGN
MVAFGFCSHSLEDKKKEKKSRLLSRHKSKREKIYSQSETSQMHLDLFEVVRSQMQIAETMDACIRQSLVQLASSTAYREIYVPQISLELLTGICKYNFPSEKLYIQWKKRQANILEELLCTSASLKTDECRDVKNMLAMIKSNEQWDISSCPLEHAEVLLTIKKYSSKLSSGPGKFGLPGETIYWTSGYHLNIKLYQKLLSCVFDILDESQLVEEAEEILNLMKFTWTALGITQKIHNALYGWLLLKQYVETGEMRLLDHAILEIQKIQGSEKDEKEIAYISCLVCSITINGSKLSVNLVDAIFMSMSVWCGCKLKDYHLNLSQEPMTFKRILTLLVSVGMLASDESGVLKLVRPVTEPELAARLIKGLIENSVHATCKQLNDVYENFNMNSKPRKQHPLAMLAHQVKLIAEKESNDFIPVLRNWCPEAGIVSSMKFHKFYGDKLPFLDKVSCLSEDVICVFLWLLC